MSIEAMAVGTDDSRQELSGRLNLNEERLVDVRCCALVPNVPFASVPFARLSSTIIVVPYGQFHAREALHPKTRLLAACVALIALLGQAQLQLKANIPATRMSGVSWKEIAQTIFQMVLHGGFPARMDAMNTAIEVFKEEPIQS